MDITATALRRKLHAALQAVANGDTVRITKHGKLIAVIQGVQPSLPLKVSDEILDIVAEAKRYLASQQP